MKRLLRVLACSADRLALSTTPNHLNNPNNPNNPNNLAGTNLRTEFARVSDNPNNPNNPHERASGTREERKKSRFNPSNPNNPNSPDMRGRRVDEEREWWLVRLGLSALTCMLLANPQAKHDFRNDNHPNHP